MATVSELKTGSGGKDWGAFRVQTFNLFDSDAADEYATLRTRANDASSGVRIENIQQFSRKMSTSQGDGEDRVVTTVEEIFIVVQYWEKKPKRDKGDTVDDLTKERRVWSREREASG